MWFITLNHAQSPSQEESYIKLISLSVYSPKGGVGNTLLRDSVIYTVVHDSPINVNFVTFLTLNITQWYCQWTHDTDKTGITQAQVAEITTLFHRFYILSLENKIAGKTKNLFVLLVSMLCTTAYVKHKYKQINFTQLIYFLKLISSLLCYIPAKCSEQ